MSMSCYHCDLPVPDSYHEVLSIDGVAQRFCCPGCLAVTQLITQSGLSGYYESREQAASQQQPLSELEQRELASYSEPQLLKELAVPVASDVAAEDCYKILLAVEGINCAACLWLIEEHLGNLEGLKSISVNLMTHRAVVVWDNNTLSLKNILTEIHQIGYKATPFQANQQEDRAKQQKQTALKRLGIAGLGAMQVMMFAVGLYAGAFQGIEEQYKFFLRMVSLIITTPVVFYSGWPFLQRAVHSIKSKQMGMDVSVSLAIAVAYIASVYSTITQTGEVYFDSVCMFIFLLTLSKYFELRIRYQASAHLHGLYRLIPQFATVFIEQDGVVTPKRVLTQSLVLGDRIYVKAGEAVPVDGEIVSDTTTLDESLLTGESTPVLRQAGDTVLAGSVNIDRAVEITANAVHSNTFAARLTLLVEQALAQKSTRSLLSDWVAKYFTATVLIIAASVFVYWNHYAPEQALMVTMSVLIVACPCALSLATPTAMVVATHALARSGFLITRPHVLPTLTKCRRVIFDKTGTLTEGQFEIISDHVLTGNRAHSYQLAAALENCSLHPIAKAFAKFLNPRQISIAAEPSIYPGQGIEGNIAQKRYRIGQADFAAEILCDDVPAPSAPDNDTGWILLCSHEAPIAWFKLQDRLNDSAKQSVVALKQAGLSVSIISGDNMQATAQLADKLQVREYLGGAKPEDKLQQCQKHQQNGTVVIMVGDGINDGPAMAQADVSIATDNGVDLTKANADAYLLHRDLSCIARAIIVAKHCDKIIKTNVTWALLYNFVAIPLAAAGLVPPYLAAIGMSFSSLLVVLNATRLNHTGAKT